MMILPTDSPVVLASPAHSSRERLGATEVEVRACVFASEELLQGRRETWIEHRGEMYRLRLTGSGKLYLTK